MTTIPHELTISEPLYVIGIDSALSKTGVAFIDLVGDSCRARTYVVATALTDDSIPERHRRIAAVGNGVAALIPSHRAELALIEAPALDADHGNSWDRAAVWWWIVGVLLGRGIPVAKAAPTTLKKWATGRGGSPKNPVNKSHIVAAMHSMWPGLPCTKSGLRHHECDALCAATACAQFLHWPVPIRNHQRASLAVVKWPQLAVAS
jgi:crossover junction endodeoxyribonuclease RuvC